MAMAAAMAAASPLLIKIAAMATEMEAKAVATTTEATIIDGTISASKVALMRSLIKSKLTLIRTTVCTIRMTQASLASASIKKMRVPTNSRSTYFSLRTNVAAKTESLQSSSTRFL